MTDPSLGAIEQGQQDSGKAKQNLGNKDCCIPGNKPGRHCAYSVKTTDCTPEISKRLRQRMFLQASMSSLRSM
jgi:hypothetical protein